MILRRVLVLVLAISAYMIARPIVTSPDPTVQTTLRYGPTIGALAKFAEVNNRLVFFSAWKPLDQRPFANTRVTFGQGDVCCPGIPSRQSTNIATGELLKP